MRVKYLTQGHNTIEPGPLDPEASALSMRPSLLSESNVYWRGTFNLFL